MHDVLLWKTSGFTFGRCMICLFAAAAALLLLGGTRVSSVFPVGSNQKTAEAAELRSAAGLCAAGTDSLVRPGFLKLAADDPEMMLRASCGSKLVPLDD